MTYKHIGSDNGELLESFGLIKTEKPEYFFSFAKQKEHTYEIAKHLYTTTGCTADEAIAEAKVFIQAAYEQIFKYNK